MQGNSPVVESLTQPVISSVSEPVNPAVSAPAYDQKPKTNSFLVILLSILLLISLSIAGFFAFQNQKLIKELTALQVVPTPVAIVEPTEIPVVAVGMTDWKIYNNEGLFTYQYPSEYTESGMGVMSPLNPIRNQKDSTLQDGELKLEFYPEKFEGSTTSESCWQDHSSGGGKITGRGSIMVDGKSYETVLWEGNGTGEFLCIANNGYRILINKYPAKTTRQDEYVDILSTFKFTN